MARVYVGMSGGVDSSVAAALLVEQGHKVTGVYMKNWTQDLPGMRCPWAEDVADAKRVAVQLGIDFKVYDFQTEYKQRVVDYMIAEYQAGNTPNPDIMCNQEVKFRLFFDAALDNGAEYIATGHYARVVHDTPARLERAVDENKDQTYFLYRITEHALRHALFPLGEYTKQQVRQMAEDRNLYTATKRESMGVCFVGNVGIREFIGQYVEAQPGDIVEHESGAVIGHHDGAIFYTIGQRHGINVGGGLPCYVVAKDMATNTVYVSHDLNSSALWRQEIQLRDLHWIHEKPDRTHDLSVRLRHRGQLIDARLDEDILRLHDAERAVTSGQSAVVYHGQNVLGGGIVV